VTPVEQRTPGRFTRGDVARVSLAVEAQSDMTWVVVNDPIPAGARILGGSLARDSALLRAGARSEGAAWPAFEERRFEGFRAYYRLVPKGRFTVEYTLRFDNPGHFELPPTRVEALYAPEMFGELPNAPSRWSSAVSALLVAPPLVRPRHAASSAVRAAHRPPGLSADRHGEMPD
jgi:uncharacterized protein YfaS (alpha-2-macroglobulin family)